MSSAVVFFCFVLSLTSICERKVEERGIEYNGYTKGNYIKDNGFNEKERKIGGWDGTRGGGGRGWSWEWKPLGGQ
jgi:hypothetical protein